MQHSHDLDHFDQSPVHRDVRQARDDELARSPDATAPSHRRKIPQPFHLLLDRIADGDRGGRIVSGDLLDDRSHVILSACPDQSSRTCPRFAASGRSVVPYLTSTPQPAG